MPVPSTLAHEDYREGSNDQVFLMGKQEWENIFANMKDQGIPDTEMAGFRKYLTQDSMTLKEAVNFLKMKSPEKDEIIKMIFGEERYEKFNFLPVSKFVLPVNVNNAVKAGIITPAEAQKAEKQIVINYKGSSMFKNNLLMMDILANFDWKRPINFSSGGIYDGSNLFFLSNYLKFDGFSYRLVPIKTEESVDGELGFVNADELYKTVKNYRWGNFKNLKTHFDETCTQNIVGYRSSASRAAEALVLKGEKKKAIEILDLASREIPVSKYDDPRSLSSIVYAYIVAGQEQKGLKLAEDLKKGIFNEYDYYTRLSPKFQVYAGRQMKTKPMEYSLVVGAVSDAYNKIGQKDKGYAYLVNSLNVIDKRFDGFIRDLQEMGKEKAFKKADDVQQVTSFYSYLFDIMKDYDTTYEAEKMDQITKKLMKVTQ